MTINNGGAFRAASGAAVILLALAFSYTPAYAHAKLLRSQPAADSKPESPPKLVELWFNEELEPGLNTVEVKDPQGNRVDRDDVTLAEGGKKVQVGLGDLAAGTYAVAWKAVSADGHTIRGQFVFSVTAAPAPAGSQATPTSVTVRGINANPPGPQAQATPTLHGGDSAEESPITWADSLVRWLGYLAMMTLFGGFASQLFVLGPSLSPAPAVDTSGGEQSVAAATRRTLLLFRVGIIVLFASLLASLVMQSAEVFGVGLAEAASPYHLGGLIGRTGFGRSWLLQIAAAVVLLVIIVALGRAVRRVPAGRHAGLWWAGLVAAAVLLYGPSMTGHAAAASKDYGLAVVSDWLHLVAGGFWVGGLFHLALALPPALSSLERDRRTRALGRVIKLFTRVAIPSVAVVVLAGLYNSWAHVGSLRELWVTSYGKMLLVKILLVLVMLALGAINGFRFGPRAKRLADAEDEHGHAALEKGFARSVKVEAALGVLVLLATAVLVFITPARSHTVTNDANITPAEIHGGR